MNTASRRTIKVTAIAVGVAQGAVWIVLCAVLMAVLPKFERIFLEFNAPLPPITKALIIFVHGLFRYWFVALPVIFAWPIVNWGVVALLSPRPEVALPRRLWYVLTWLAPILFAGLAVVAVLLPLTTVLTPLSR